MFERLPLPLLQFAAMTGVALNPGGTGPTGFTGYTGPAGSTGAAFGSFMASKDSVPCLTASV
jgi:hypothetical protein